MSDDLLQHVLKHPPRCLSGVGHQPTTARPTRGAQVAAFQISSSQADAAGRVRGYLLGRFSSSYGGPPTFLSPISIQWDPSGRVDEIFDGKHFGYHAESGSTSAQLRGKGETDDWVCPKCQGNLFHVVMCFDYYGGAADLWEDEPELPIQDYFNGLRIFATCIKCSNESKLLGMEL